MVIGKKKELYPAWGFCTSLEGQVVFWVDEIAQIVHDLNDGIGNELISLEDLSKKLSRNSNNTKSRIS